MESLSVPLEGNTRSLSQSLIRTGTIKKWLKSYKISILGVLMSGMGVGLAPMRWRLVGMVVCGLVGGILVELLDEEDAIPQTKKSFWCAVRDRAS